MDLFKEYTTLIESYLEQRLQQEIPNFDMEQFYEMLRLARVLHCTPCIPSTLHRIGCTCL